MSARLFLRPIRTKARTTVIGFEREDDSDASVVSLLDERSLKAGARIAIPLDLRMPTGLSPTILP